ncbi:MAG: metal-dependent transcriptional regulator [Armatimonadota bacterium]
MTTEKREEYLEQLYKLSQETDSVKSASLAHELGLSSSTTSEMVKKLKEDGLIDKDKKELTLTRKGEKEALNIIRKHRLAERFFTDVLRLRWDDVHEEACRFEHVLSDKVADALEKVLKNPDTCPHGNPIPRHSVLKEEKNIKLLSCLKAKQRGIVAKITDESKEFLCYLATLGLIPDAHVYIEQIAPFNGPMLIKVGKSKYAVGKEIADKIWVKQI